MEPILVLDDSTIDQIAAGEVVERPASVVKELVENAIDAKAAAITVEIREGGTTFIRITDNGSGIEKSQVSAAFLRHATSKIRRADDLYSIASLGFRGEALSSIAAVSKTEVITKRADDLTGLRYVIEGGRECASEEIGAPAGTTFIVRELFFNTPVRAKFLKSTKAEGNAVTACMEQMALSHPDISFKYIQNANVRLYTSGNGNLKELLYQIFGRAITKEVLPINYHSEFLSVRGFIGTPAVARASRNFENYYVNGRYVKSKLIAKAIEDAYHGFMMQHSYPFTLLYIELDRKLVDVNVHPQKMELRFSHQEDVYYHLMHAIKEALYEREDIPVAAPDRQKRRTDKENPPAAQGIPEPFETNRRAKGAAPSDSHSKGQLEHTPEDTKKEVSIHEAGTYEANSYPKAFIRPGTSGEGGHEADVGPNMDVALSDRDHTGTLQKPEADMEVGKAEADEHPSGKSADAAAKSRSGNPLPYPETDIEEEAAVWLPLAPDKGEPAPDAQGWPASKGPVPTEGEEPGQQSDELQPGEIHSGEMRPETADAEASPHTNDALQALESKKSGESETTPQQMELFDEKFLSAAAKSRSRIIGQLFETYWLVEYNDNLYIIDQHAAHEKVLYEQLMKNYRDKEIYAQYLSPAPILSLSAREEELLLSHREIFASFGFDIEAFGGKEIRLRAVPANLYGIEKGVLFTEILDGLDTGGRTSSEDLIAHRIATMACKAAVKGNQRISIEEAGRLIDELLTLDNPYHCPHGRPTIISMSRYEIEKKFKRIV